jgi:hypothetical protein
MTQPCTPHRLALLPTARAPPGENAKGFEVNDINDLDEDGLHQENKSIYEINNAKMDVPWQLDLKNKNTVKKLMTNSNNLRERCLAGTCYKTSFDFDDAVSNNY